MTERKQISLQKDDTQAALDALERLLSYTNGLGDGAAYTIRAALTAQLTKTDDNVSCPRVANTGDINAELLEALKAAKWKGEPSGNLEKGWVTTASGQRFTSLGSRKMYGKFLEEHNKQIDYIIARAEQKGK